jgi:phosphonate utilization associated putative membrane protein
MDSALLAIGCSVLMHVAWNLLARHVDSRCNFLWWGLLAHLLLFGPWALWSLWTEAQWTSLLVATLLITGLANSLYFISLRRAYHHAPVALVYPVARSSPLLIACWSLLLFDERLGLAAWLGILLNIGGLWLMSRSARGGDAAHALPWALLAALATSVYSLSDKAAVGQLPTFASQMGFVTVGYLFSFVTLSVRQQLRHGAWLPPCRPALRYALPGGLFVGTAYALVIHAMQTLPATYAVAYTNAGIVLAALLSMTIFGERDAWRLRLLAMLMICAGLLSMGLARG